MERAWAISALVRGSWEGWGVSLPRMGRAGLAGKKWSRRAWLIVAGESASGREGKRGFFLGETNFFAVHIFCWVLLARKEDQWKALALFIASK